jgi:hypothetical protein
VPEADLLSRPNWAPSPFVNYSFGDWAIARANEAPFGVASFAFSVKHVQ